MPAHSSPTNGRMSLSQLPLPWDGNAASVPVLKEPLAPINTQSPPVPSTAKEINEQPVSETAGATEDLGPEKLSAQNAAEPSAARVETEYLGKATRQEDKQTQGDSRRAHNETKKSLERVQENSSSSEPRQVPCDMEADADAFTETQADPIKPVAERSASMEAAATVKPVQDAPAVVEEEGMPLDEAPPPRYEPHMEAAALTVDDEEDYAMVEPDDLETSGPPESQMDDEVFSEVESEAGEYTELVIPVDEVRPFDIAMFLDCTQPTVSLW